MKHLSARDSLIWHCHAASSALETGKCEVEYDYKGQSPVAVYAGQVWGRGARKGRHWSLPGKQK